MLRRFADERLIGHHAENGQAAAEDDRNILEPTVDQPGRAIEVRLPENEQQGQADRQRHPDGRCCGHEAGLLAGMPDDFANQQGPEPGLPKETDEAHHGQQGGGLADHLRRKQPGGEPPIDKAKTGRCDRSDRQSAGIHDERGALSKRLPHTQDGRPGEVYQHDGSPEPCCAGTGALLAAGRRTSR